MKTASPAIQNLARRLIALEASRNPSDGSTWEVARACARLRTPIAKLAGAAGFSSLMARALALATREAPCLETVRVQADGSLEGYESASNSLGAVRGAEAGAIVVVQLLWLLVTFIGEPMTLRLVRDAWPEAGEAETSPKAEEHR